MLSLTLKNLTEEQYVKIMALVIDAPNVEYIRDGAPEQEKIPEKDIEEAREKLKEFNAEMPECAATEAEPNIRALATQVPLMRTINGFSMKELARRVRESDTWKYYSCRCFDWIFSYGKAKAPAGAPIRYIWKPLTDTDKPKWLYIWENKFKSPQAEAEKERAKAAPRYSDELLKAASFAGLPPECVKEYWEKGIMIGTPGYKPRT